MSGGRKFPAHPPFVERPNESIILFVTVCTKDRRRILARQDVFELPQATWRESTNWLIGRFVVMPDHVHFLCGPGELPPPDYFAWMNYWKNCTTRKWPKKIEPPIWLRDGWDTQIRHLTHLNDRYEYIRQNPVRAGLVRAADDWPYQGELNELRW